MFELANPPEGFVDNPFPVYDTLLANTPVCPQPDGSVVVCRHADLAEIYRDTDRFISDKRAVFAPKFGRASPLFEHHTTSLVFNDPPLHSRVRRIMTSALTPKALKRLTPGLTATVDVLLDDLGRDADLISDFASRIPVEVIGNLLGVPKNERGPLRDWSLAILGALEPVLSDEQIARGNGAVTDFSAYLRNLIAARRSDPGDPETDVLTRLIAGDKSGQLSETELIHNCIFILNAGHETTTNLIGSALVLFDEHRDQRNLLIGKPELLSGAIEEVLRFRPPNQFGNRETTSEVTLGKVTVPAHTNLHLCIGAANRDPEVFNAPHKFDIARQPNRHLAFAAGPHVCVGLTLARMEGQIALARFLDRFPDYRILRKVSGGRIRFHGPRSLTADIFGGNKRRQESTA